jgi:hypothetical protein
VQCTSKQTKGGNVATLLLTLTAKEKRRKRKKAKKFTCNVHGTASKQKAIMWQLCCSQSRKKKKGEKEKGEKIYLQCARHSKQIKGGNVATLLLTEP